MLTMIRYADGSNSYGSLRACLEQMFTLIDMGVDGRLSFLDTHVDLSFKDVVDNLAEYGIKRWYDVSDFCERQDCCWDIIEDKLFDMVIGVIE